MKLFMQIAIVFGICLAGIVITEFLPFPFPSSVMSMILMFLLLITKVVKIENVETFSGFLLGNMAFLFLPLNVEIMDYFDVIGKNIIPFLVICAVSTVLTFGITGYTVRLIMIIQRKLSGGETN